ncbi:MAG: hypothetical protein K9G49_03280 [Taibaiella sp.]|nr:hypothetical protein [Taibaiella sp.]
MRKVVLFLLALSVVTLSCQKSPKSVKVPVSYVIESGQNAPLGDTYIPDAGTYTMPVLVKYLGGYQEDKVTISIKGLPADVTVAQDTFSKVPTYRADFVFTTTNAVHATYPITITASAPGSDPKTYTFNLSVISADCAASLWGALSGANACTARNFNYVSTGVATGVTNELDIVNFGGYGSSTKTRVKLNCVKDSLTIPSQNIGNGTVLQGSGTFSGNTMTIYYTASSTPGGFPETCTATYTRQ